MFKFLYHQQGIVAERDHCPVPSSVCPVSHTFLVVTLLYVLLLTYAFLECCHFCLNVWSILWSRSSWKVKLSDYKLSGVTLYMNLQVVSWKIPNGEITVSYKEHAHSIVQTKRLIFKFINKHCQTLRRLINSTNNFKIMLNNTCPYQHPTNYVDTGKLCKIQIFSPHCQQNSHILKTDIVSFDPTSPQGKVLSVSSP